MVPCMRPRRLGPTRQLSLITTAKSVYLFLIGLVKMIYVILFGKRLHHCPSNHHLFVKAQQGRDDRSPCPALNTLANHGYLPRDGRRIHVKQLFHALVKGYNVSYPMGAVLAYGGLCLLGQFQQVSLHDMCRHRCIEHKASLVHDDCPPNGEYAPTALNREFLQHLIDLSVDRVTIGIEEIAQARVNRENSYINRMDLLHAEIARGEAALLLGVFGGRTQRVPISLLTHWLEEERLPDGWTPEGHVQTLSQTIRTAWAIRKRMQQIRQDRKNR